MKTRKTILPLSLIAVALAITLYNCSGPRLNDGMRAFEGDWMVVEYVEKSKAIDQAARDRLCVNFCKGLYQKVEKLGKEPISVEECSVRVDRSKAPLEIDFVVLHGNEQGNSRLGIFELEANLLKICWGEVGAARPKKFEANRTSTLMVLIRKR